MGVPSCGSDKVIRPFRPAMAGRPRASIAHIAYAARRPSSSTRCRDRGIGDLHPAGRADRGGEPGGDRSGTGADLQAVPARADAHRRQVPDGDPIELRRHAGQASSLLLPSLIEKVGVVARVHGHNSLPGSPSGVRRLPRGHHPRLDCRPQDPPLSRGSALTPVPGTISDHPCTSPQASSGSPLRAPARRRMTHRFTRSSMRLAPATRGGRAWHGSPRMAAPQGPPPASTSRRSPTRCSFNSFILTRGPGQTADAQLSALLSIRRRT